MLEEELEAVRREVTYLQRRLGEVEDEREALEDGALAFFLWWSRRRPCGWISSTPSPRSSARR